jgi:hypothetical protein
MALADLQRLLTRVLTSPESRESLRAECANLSHDKQPLEEATPAVMNIPLHQLTHYAEALVNKRCRAVGQCLPATLRMLGSYRFRERFRVHATETWPTGSARHRDDAIAFADTISRAPEPEWTDLVIDLAAYEAATLRARDPTRMLVAILVRYTPEDLISAATSGRRGAGLTRRPTLVLWIRLWKGGPSKVIRFSTPQSRPMPSESATRLM